MQKRLWKLSKCILKNNGYTVRNEDIMNIVECYESIGSDFNNVLKRLGSESLVKHFALKFLNDDSFNQLKLAYEIKDTEKAFHAVHTLKGVCGNLGFDKLYKISADLTEKLRNGNIDGTEALFEEIQEQYNIIVQAIQSVE